jgi:hypothetical protein
MSTTLREYVTELRYRFSPEQEMLSWQQLLGTLG